MRFTSLIVELMRARPRLMFAVVALFLATLWIAVPLLVYRSPPGDVALTLTYGREYPLGTPGGPPLAFWLADIAFRFAGNSIIGVYLLAQACTVVTLWAVFLLARAIVGGPQAAVAVLLTATIVAFGFPNLDFGPDVLAQPLWALLLFHAWQIIGQGRRNAWFALSIEAGLLLLTSPAAIVLLALIALFFAATPRGRRACASVDPLFAVIVIAALALPYLIWLTRNGSVRRIDLPSVADLAARGQLFATLLGGLLLSLAGLALLVVLNAPRFVRKPQDMPLLYRPPLDDVARPFVVFFALAPALVGAIIASLVPLDHVFGGAGVALTMAGLATVVAANDLIYLRRQRFMRTVWVMVMIAPAVAIVALTVIRPWMGDGNGGTGVPAREIGKFFAENYQRRTNQPLRAVAGDQQLATLIGFAAPTRPHVYLERTPEKSPWIDAGKFNSSGGVVVWRAADTAGTPPPDILASFPGLAPEVPRVFDRLVNGRQPPLRIGWGIVRPKAN